MQKYRTRDMGENEKKVEEERHFLGNKVIG